MVAALTERPNVSGWAARRTAARPGAAVRAAWGFAEWFVISQTAIPALLYLPGSQPFRLLIRSATFLVSLAGLLWWFGTRPRPGEHGHRAWPCLIAVVACLALMLFHPTTNSTVAGLAQIALYLAVLAPAFWAPRLVQGPAHLARLLALLLVCNGVNSLVGILQVYDPGRWMPEEFSRVVTTSRFGLDAVSYVGPGGKRVVRPPGLFDAPGAVCGPGMVTVLLGLMFCLRSGPFWKKAAAAGLTLLGMAAVFLSHVRSSFVVVAAAVVVGGAVFASLQRQRLRAVLLLGLAGLLLLGAFSFAVVLGGESTRDRFLTLVEGDPFQLYYDSRGNQVEYGFRQLLTEYPLGAGLGRWGMVHVYFGDPWNRQSSPIWAEVQPNAWTLDGGLVLLALYGGALAAGTAANLRLIRWGRDRDLRFWAAAVFVANLCALALTLSFTPFTNQIGLQYWLLSGALHGAALNRAKPA
jgi:hypothetical protein